MFLLYYRIEKINYLNFIQTVFVFHFKSKEWLIRATRRTRKITEVLLNIHTGGQVIVV